MKNNQITIVFLVIILFLFQLVPLSNAQNVESEELFPVQNSTLIEIFTSEIFSQKGQFCNAKLEKEYNNINSLCYEAFPDNRFPIDKNITEYQKRLRNEIGVVSLPLQLYHRSQIWKGSLYHYNSHFRRFYDYESWPRKALYFVSKTKPPQQIEVRDFAISCSNDRKYTLSLQFHWKESMSKDSLLNLRYTIFLKADHLYYSHFSNQYVSDYVQNIPIAITSFTDNKLSDYKVPGFPLFEGTHTSVPKKGDSVVFSTHPFALPFLESIPKDLQPNWSIHIVLHDANDLSNNLYSFSFPITNRTGDHSLTNFPFPNTITIDNRVREYYLYIPSYMDITEPCHLVIVLHGGGGNAWSAMEDTDWNDIARYYNCIIAYPEGTRKDMSRPPSFVNNPQTWNDGSNRKTMLAVNENSNDILFFRTMIEDIKKACNINPSHIHITGFSNGGSMTFRAAREMDDVLASAAPIACSDWLQNPEEPYEKSKLSICYITGTIDPLNPMDGGEIFIGKESRGVKPPVKEMIQKWVSRIGASPVPKLLRKTDTFSLEQYYIPNEEPTSKKPKVQTYFINGLGHHYPGSSPMLPESIAGPTKNIDAIDATSILWNFFRNHPKTSKQ